MSPGTLARNAPAILTLATLILAMKLPVVTAQTRPGSDVEAQSFEVASVRPNNSGPAGLAPLRALPNGSVLATNVPFRGVIMYAYGLALYESVEGDSEFLEERFDVNAKAATPPKPGRPGELGGLNVMMQNLLVERFGLVVRWAERLGDGYVLLRSRSDGRLGPGMQRSDFQCPRTTPIPPDDARRCDITITNNVMSVAGHRMVDFARELSYYYDAPVMDRTELDGWFAFQLRFNARDLPRSLRLLQPRPLSDAELGLPSFLTALQEELGLRLERQQVTRRVLIVEQVHALREN